MRAIAAGLLLLLLVILGAPSAAPLSPPFATQPTCADASEPALFAPWDTQLENLAFLGSTLLVSDIGGDRLLTFAQDGTLVSSRSIPGMHGLTVGPDGLAYLGAAGVSGPEVWRIDSSGAIEVVATGLPAANGLTFDAVGNLFVSSPLTQEPPYLVRVPAGGGAWEAWGDTYGTNGLWRDGDSILSAVTADQSSPIVRISTSDPDDVALVAELSFGAATLQPGAHAPSGPIASLAPKGLDDLTLGPDGMIYVAAHVTGELLRVDPTTGSACVLASGFQEPTSVRFAPGFGPWAGDLFVTDMGGEAVTALFGPGAGAIWVIDRP